MINEIHCCDYLELFSKISDNSIDLVLTDPPFWHRLSKQLY